MILIAIVVGTLLAGIGSVWLAAMLSFGALARYTQHMLSMAAGALLSTAFLHLLPEAMESEAGAHDLFMVLLVGIVFFFLLDKAELWHHGHEHHHGEGHRGHSHSHTGHGHDHDQGHGHDHGHGNRGAAQVASAHGTGAPAPVAGSWAVLAGDSVHCFGDGVLIASAFMAEWRLGVLAALAVLAHEVPHHMGDLVVLREGSGSRRMALIKVSLAGAVTTLGGVLGYWLLEQLRDYLPFFLVLASSSFIYVALADLIPQLQQRLGARQTLYQVLWLVLGVLLVGTVSGLAH